ncbi:MAG: caspase family protein [Bacteroidota bacterium]
MTRLLQIAVVLSTLFISQLNAKDAVPAGCQEGNCFNGYGKFLFANGNKYEGYFQSGKPHGNGILFCTNGNRYYGQWSQSWRQGEGRFVFKEGHEYKGGFHKNNFHGIGTMKYANGDKYEGNWHSNLPNGKGTYVFQEGGHYEGNFLDGRFDGQGSMFYKNGALYVGEWSRSKKHGKGIYTDSKGKKHEGEWVNGKPMNTQVMDATESETILVKPAEGQLSSEKKPANGNAHKVEKEDRSTVRIWATVVGVANYNHMPSLRYTDDDAYQFYAFLKSPEGGALPDEQVRVLVDDNATKENILEAMRSTFMSADENDVVLFYFSGHGVEGAFIPVDFDGFDNRLHHHEIRQILDGSPAKHKLVVGDACHAGSLYGANLEDDMVASRNLVSNMLDKYYGALNNTDGGLALLMSSKGQEVSLEDSGLRSGVFSHFLIRGLKGEADYNRDKIVTIEEVFEFTNVKVSGYTVGAQTPVLTGYFDGQMPVSVVRR